MKEMTKAQIVERSLFKKFRKDIWTKFVLALKRYNLVEDEDKIAVCISGGKDSMLLAKLMQMLQKISEVKFELVFLCMDPGYNKENRDRIEKNAALLEIPIEFFETDIFDSVVNVEKSPCYLCARMRRGHLYSEAQKRGCNKIALGHHFCDVIETTVMGMLYGAQIQAMPPKLCSKNFEGMQLIRPLYCVHEDGIIAWKNYHQLKFLQCACRFTEQCALSEDEISPSARVEVRNLIKSLKEKIPEVEAHIFKSIHNVQLDTLLGVKYQDEDFDFNALFEAKEKKRK
ncbi:MAG: tRNA 2-thiocytidine biosynthesis protein TtcA [Clostridia bacterium]|nr:tRNA 2-thiocytidine biosynthesis protein TtcA [Clostridia bacterium]